MTASGYPHFPESGLRFLRGLKRNNNREWFQNRKEVYEESVRAPMVGIIEALADELARFAPEIAASPKESLYRIYRDTRFSPDKSPYKTHVAAVFPARELGRHEGAGFYFHIAPSEVLIGGGLYRPPSGELQAVRSHIADAHERLHAIVNAPPFRRMFGALTGEQLSRLPRGFPKDHPASDYLRLKDFLASRTLAPAAVATPKFLPAIVDTFRTLHPLVAFLNEPILADRRSRQRRDAFLKGV